MNWILFDDNGSVPARAILFDQPVEWITCTAIADVAGNLARAERALREGLHVAGALAYELGYALEEKLRPCAWPESETPLISLGLFERRRELIGDEIELWLDANARLHLQNQNRHGRACPGHPSGRTDKAENLPTDLSSPRNGEMDGRDKPGHDELGLKGRVRATPRWDVSRYAEAFARVHDYIAAGDVYQVNLTFPLDVEIEGDLVSLYRELRRNARSRYGAFMALPDATILSLSPELFFQIENGIIRTRPMKGTVARAPSFEEDRKVAAELATDEKQCAENLMIVDLLRNDLSRIAQKGSVEVENLFTVETFPTLHTMTSGVRAELRPGTSLTDILRAVFPCGSVTGAPKVRAMEIIRELETAPRGVYCGALGWFSGADARLNVAIRTLEVRNGRARLHVGGGLVYDSTAQGEYDEALLKARFLTDPAPPFSLIETMRLDANGIWLWERHLDRLRKSASYFLFPLHDREIERALDEAIRQLDRSVVHRVRLLLDASGKISVTATPLSEAPSAPPMPTIGLQIHPHPMELTVAISAVRVRSSDRYFHHKTTRREIFDAEFERAAKEQGSGEILFLNERGELTEGSRSNLFIAKDGLLLTPPLSSGVLPGCLRAELMSRQSPPVVEKVLTPDDLTTADAIYLGNSVRGLMRVNLIA